MSTLYPRPSHMPWLEACSRWVSRPKAETEADQDALDEAAAEGTVVHAAMERLVLNSAPDGWDAAIEADGEILPALKPLVRECAAQIMDLFIAQPKVYGRASFGLDGDDRMELVPLVCVTPPKGVDWSTKIVLSDRAGKLTAVDSPVILSELGVDPSVTLPGTLDLLFVQGNRAVLVDFKTNRVVRAHDRQLEAYAVGVFAALPFVDFVEIRIVTPRLGEVHKPVLLTRQEDEARLIAELKHIVEQAEDPFTPGHPGEACAFCAGNGRCPYQAATLRDIPVAVEALVKPHEWAAMLAEDLTPELRGQRRQVVSWLKKFAEAVTDNDKAWAETNPDAELPGFTKVVQQGRLTLDKADLAAANESLRLAFGLEYPILVAFLVPDRAQLAEFLALHRGLTNEEAKRQISQALSSHEKRGAPIVAFRAVKKEGKTRVLRA